MTSWVLILYIYAGMMAKNDEVTLTNVPGFATQQECEQAGRAAAGMASGHKEARYVCVRQTKN